MSKDKELGFGRAVCISPGHSLHVKKGDCNYKPSGRNCGILASKSNRTFIDFDIDTSDFMNTSLPFPWDDNQCTYRHTDLDQQLRYSFESSSSTIHGSYRSTKTSLLSDNIEGIAKARQLRESILIPDYPQDLACYHIKACRSRPADLRTMPEDPAIQIQASIRHRPSYKRSITPSQLDSLAGALGDKSARPSYPPRRCFESTHSQERPLTASLSFSSTLASSPAPSIMSSCSESKEIPSRLAAKTCFAAASGTNNFESRTDIRSSSPSSMSFGCKQVQRNFSSPLPNTVCPSMMNLTISTFSPEVSKPERTFQSSCETTKPLASPQMSLSPRTLITQAEPPSWFDLDDDTSEQPSKHINLATKLSIPHLYLRSESSNKKTSPVLETKIKYRSEDNTTISSRMVDTTHLNKPCTRSKEDLAQISLSSSAPVLVQTKGAQATLKKSPVSSKIMVPTGGFTTKTLKRKNSRKVKIGSPSKKNKEKSAGQRFRGWFQTVFD